MDWGSCVENGVATLRCIPAVFSNLIRAALMFVGVVAIFFIIYSGYQLLTSGGDPKKVQGGRQTLTFAIIGLIVVLSSFLIINFIGVITNTSNCLNHATDATKFLTGC